MIQSDNKLCILASNGYDQRAKGACCFILHKFHLDKSQPLQGIHPSTKDLSSSPATAKSWFDEDWSKEIRYALARGEEHPACEKCWQDEANGKYSKRFHANNSSRNMKSEPEGVLTHLTLFSGNKCNLACRTCGAHSSTSWIKEHRYINKQDSLKLPFFNHPPKVKKFDPNTIDVPIDKLQSIEVLGGEPFYETDHLEFLERVCREADPGNITLFYSTNGTKTLDPNIQKMFSKFKSILISFSIDAVGKKFEYIRTLGNWDQVEETIAFWKNFPNVMIKNHATVSILNMMYLKELYNYFIENNNFTKEQLGYTMLRKPQHYSFSVINNNKRTKHMDWILQSMSYGHHTPSIQNYFKSTEYNKDDFKHFLYSVKHTNDFRHLDIQDYLPELCKVLAI